MIFGQEECSYFYQRHICDISVAECDLDHEAVTFAVLETMAIRTSNINHRR